MLDAAAFVIFLLNALLIAALTLLGLERVYSDYVRKKAPFVPIPKEMLPYLCEAVEFTDKDVVYDLGSGDGRILRALYLRFPQARYVGIELSFFAHLLALVLRRDIPASRISLARKGYFTVPLQDATCVIMYLLPKSLEKLMPKLERELRPGTLAISLDFELPWLFPVRTVETPLRRGRFIYVYRF